MGHAAIKYRKDIDGLRGVAVLAVVFYHFAPYRVPGGFIGVDMFLVISGYLITSLIYAERMSGKFSFKEFYRRRARRILPAFFGVILGVLFLGTAILLPQDFSALAQSTRAAILLVSNHYFANLYDYFLSTWELPLAHTWSLSIEEQFYLIWPLLFFLGTRKKLLHRGYFGVVAIALISSFLFGEYLLNQPFLKKEAYYLLSTRAGELLTGALIALPPLRGKYLPERFRGKLANLGLLIFLGSAFLIKGSDPFPGFLALLPCLAAALIISDDSEGNSLAARILTFTPVVAIGLVSYSLYLWHWPILAFGRYFSGDRRLTPSLAAGLLTIIVVMTYLSWRFIEQPFRKRDFSFRKTLTLSWFVPASIALFLCSLIISSGGWPGRLTSRQTELVRDSKLLSDGFCFDNRLDNCAIGVGKGAAKAILFGDSNAGHYMPFWDELGRANRFSISAIGIDRCFPLLDIEGQKPSEDKSLVNAKCPQLIRYVSSRIDDYDLFIFAGAWSGYFGDPEKPNFEKELEASLAYLSKRKKQIFVMEQAPVFATPLFNRYFRAKFSLVPLFWAKNSLQELQKNTLSEVANANETIRKIAARHPSITVVSPISLLKEEKHLLPLIEGRLAYMNYGHLNEEGSRALARKVMGQLHQELDILKRISQE